MMNEPKTPATSYRVLSSDEARMIQDYEKGMRLQSTTQSAGYQDLLDIMEEEVKQAEFCLMNYNGVDAEEVKALHRRARDMREFFQNIQKKVLSSVNAIEEIRRIAEQSANSLDETFKQDW